MSEEAFDFIIMGTGLAETAIGYLLSKNKKYKILQIDKNPTYGSEFSTFNLTQLLKYFNQDNGA